MKTEIAKRISLGIALGAIGFGLQTDTQEAPHDNNISLNLDKNQDNGRILFVNEEFVVIPEVSEGPYSPTIDEVGFEASKLFSQAVVDREAEEAAAEIERQEREKIVKVIDQIVEEEPKDNSDIPSTQSTGIAQGASTSSSQVTAKITGYYCQYDSGYYGDGGNFCHGMADGATVHNGAAACGYYWKLGTELYITSLGRKVICEDRGILENTQVDVFSYFSSGLVPTHVTTVSPLNQ